ncbi:glycosyltransferase [Mesobacterium pallidum]|uniref:glycosyltransferase n=1 Tax=Mesobacterium pallidum TaxID=2872037 RepID=UPI001EE24856|nr:cellulose synthase catalytic subunit [Mesobacterium pallidum]
MLDLLNLGLLGSSLLHLVPIAGAALLLPSIIDKTSNVHRHILFGIAILLSLRYAWWRITDTIAPIGFTVDFVASWSLMVLEMATMIGSFSAFVLLMRYRDRGQEVADNLSWWHGGETPRVSLLIATYNEEVEVLERTILGAKALTHKAKEVLVLDDGRRDWLRDYCAEQGVGYLRRPDNKGSKAGNINHALGVLAARETPPDYVAVLDADFVPHRGFISRTLALFHDADVGLVQTPQHFFNADPIQHNLGISRSYPDEQRFFFDHMQPSRDGWGIAFCCGTSSMIRFSALMDIGGFPTESVTEDFMLTLVLQNKGWRTVYLNEPLTEGLAPEGLKEYITQRARWCLGLMQIARGSMGPLAKNDLRLRDRWSVADSVFYWLTTFAFRFASVIFPLLYWFFNVTVVDAALPDVISYFGCYFLWTIMVLNLMAPGTVIPLLNDVSQLIGSIQITRSAWTGLIKPHGHPFSVTAKGGDRSRIVIQWRIMAPFAILLILTLTGLLLGIFTDRFAFSDAADGKWVILFWTIYNLIVLSITVIACFELPRREAHVADKPERVTFTVDGTATRLWMTGLTADHARLRGKHFDAHVHGILTIDDIGDVPAEVVTTTGDGARLALRPDAATRDKLLLRFYFEGDQPGVGATNMSGMLRDLARRLSFHAGPQAHKRKDPT